MTNRMLWNGLEIPALGLGCWAIGGPFYAGNAPLGWGEVDDAESVRAIHTAVELGVRFFDTAPIYGTGRSEEVLGSALAAHPEVLVGTKLGVGMDERSKQIAFTDEAITPAALVHSIDASLRRLRRERIDLVHLHLNSLPTTQAAVVFDTLAKQRIAGKIDAFGWSTDYPTSAAAFAASPDFVSVQHAMNVFFRATDLMHVIEQHGLLSINRSPLAMGLLSGKYAPGQAMAADDIRGHTHEWMAYFKDGQPAPSYTRQLDAVRALLQTDGRTLVQGALAWLWARSARTLPIPGFRTVAQVQELAGALAKGPLPSDVMEAIERSIQREPEGPARDR